MKRLFLSALLTLVMTLSVPAATPLENLLSVSTLPDFSAKRSMASGMVAAASDPMFCYDGWAIVSQGTSGPWTFTIYRCPSTTTEIECSGLTGQQEYCVCTYWCAD